MSPRSALTHHNYCQQPSVTSPELGQSTTVHLNYCQQPGRSSSVLHGSINTSRKQCYRRIINRLRVQMHRAKKRKAVAGKLNIACNARINHIVEQAAREFLPDLTLNFFKSQMKAFSNKRAQSMRWSEKDKLIALSIYYHGLKTYRFLLRLFLEMIIPSFLPTKLPKV